MSRWKLIDHETASRIWDENLARMPDNSPFQTFAWGQYNRALGWEPLYFGAVDQHDRITAMCLALLRRFPLRTGMIWCTGGLTGDIARWDENFRQAVIAAANLKRLYFRFRSDRERDVSDVLLLTGRRWSPARFALTSGLSMELDLSQTEEKLKAALSGKWRRNLKLARQAKLSVSEWRDPSIEPLCRLFAEMEKRKNLPPLFSPEKLAKLFPAATDNLLFLGCEGEDGAPAALRACLISGDRACDYLAATGDQGLKTRASYLLLWEMLLRCRERGVRWYDLGGIDPAANPGVYTFKKETGARQIELLGEWDWATAEWLRLFGNWAIKRRQNARAPAEKKRSISLLALSIRMAKNLGRRKKPAL